MKNSWKHFFRRFATVSLTCGSLAWSSAIGYAQIASDNASDPVYADGWQAGDNGGTGFTPWNFHGSYASTDQHSIDNGLKSGIATSSPFNDLGRAWRLSNTVVIAGQRDIARAGRGFAPLQVGQTVRVVIDNPSQQQFFRGYFVRLNGGTGGMNGNICYNGTPCSPGGTPDSKFHLQMFEYFSYGQWSVIGSTGIETTLFDTDIDRPDPQPDQVGTDMGMQMDFTLTGADTYNVKMTPLDNPAAAYMQSGSLETPGVPIDWIEITFFNTQSDPGVASDFYIKSLEIVSAAPPGVPGDYNNNGTVDAADYVVWRNGGPLQNEVAGVTPGQVTAEDYAAWRARFGNGTPAAANGNALTAGAIPEPITFVYLVVAALGVAIIGVRREITRPITWPPS